MFGLAFKQNPKLRNNPIVFEVPLLIEFYFCSDLVAIDIECLHHLQLSIKEIDKSFEDIDKKSKKFIL